MSGLISLLSGAAFRAVWGEVSAFISKKQDHAHELEMMKLQAELDDKVHSRELKRIRLSSELKVSEVRVQGEIDTELADIETFAKGLESLNRKSGVRWVDAWNASVRPAFASFALGLWFWSVLVRGFILTPFDIDLICGIVGFFFANRELGRRK